MRGYLLDENIPSQLSLATAYPIVSARALGASLTDAEIWAIAQREQWAIVSKDADFADRILVADPPPWIIHLRIGNLRLSELRQLLAHIWSQIEALLPRYKLITIYHERIEAIATQ